MSEPLSGSGTAAALGGATVFGLFTGTDFGIVFGAFAGALFVATIPQNLRPPYIAVDVRNSIPLQMAPVVFGGERFQLVQDSVRLTLYGFSNKMALDLVDSVVNRALEEEKFGVTNIPVVQDAKSGQVEINALAKKKIVDFDVNYYQSTAREISRQLIEKVICKYEVK